MEKETNVVTKFDIKDVGYICHNSKIMTVTIESIQITVTENSIQVLYQVSDNKSTQNMPLVSEENLHLHILDLIHASGLNSVMNTEVEKYYEKIPKVKVETSKIIAG